MSTSEISASCRTSRTGHARSTLSGNRSDSERTRSPEMARERADRLRRLEIDFIDSPEFETPGLGRQIAREVTPLLDRIPTSANIDVATGQHTLLSAAEERALFRGMNFYKRQASEALASLHPTRPGLTSMDRIDRALFRSEQIRDLIVLSNLRLVVSISRRLSSSKIPFEDLISDGNLILMRAVEKFDYYRGYRFSTYATHAVQRDIFRKFQRYGRDSKRFLAGSQEFLHDLSDESTSPQKNVHHHSVFSHLLTLIERELDDRERFIVKARFGLATAAKPLKLRNIAEELGLSKERVRQLQNRAIGKLQENIPWDAILFELTSSDEKFSTPETTAVA